MTSRSQTLALLVVALLASGLARSPAQDPPLYRDPNPTDGPRIDGPVLPPRPPSPNSTLPPPGGLGPFQLSTPGPDSTGLVPSSVSGAEPIREPMLGVSPMPPPLPAIAMQPMESGQDVVIKRTTKIRGPNGVLGRFHEWFHDICFGPPRPPTMSTVPKHGFFAAFHSSSPEPETPTRFFNWPTWPTWPVSSGR